jgi:RNA polymerase sigma-70 factor (ECF subfamily)
MATSPDDAFLKLVAPHRDALRLHCYRMLGSSHDGDDMLQETLVRAWRSRESLDDTAALRPWLYRIATNVCLDELKDRARRPLPSDVTAPSDPNEPPAPATPEVTWLEPCPDGWLGGATRDPGAAYEVRESVALAFVAALQLLPPQQRAVLLLRDVLGSSAEETAGALGLSVSAANSALHRARESVKERVGDRDATSFAGGASEVEASILRRYVSAWERADVDALVALLHEEVTATMPPSPTWLRGRDATRTFLATFPMRRFRAAPPRLVPVGANGQPAFAFYSRGEDAGAELRLYAIHVVHLRNGLIDQMHHFATPQCFGVFGVPAVALR